jgi:acetolactate synthase-1/2/3 large subunit
MSIAADQFRPYAECVGEVGATLSALAGDVFGPFDWCDGDLRQLRRELLAALGGCTEGADARRGDADGLSPYDLTCRLRELTPPDTIVTTDVGAVKFVTSQAFAVHAPMRFLQSNGLSSMGFAVPAAMAARLVHPGRPILCTVGDGGFGMSMAEIETCVREDLRFVTVVYNDRQLSLIRVIQQNKGLPARGVQYGEVDFAAAAEALGAAGFRVSRASELDAAVRDAFAARRVAVVDVRVDPAEYASHTRPCAL